MGVRPSALWLPYEVTDLDTATRYCAGRYQSDRKSRWTQNVAWPPVGLMSGYFRSSWYYTDHLGLSVVDGWDDGGERGVVLAAGAAFVELVSAPTERSGPSALQLADPAEVDRFFAGLRPAAGELLAAPHRYPRGHYGFEVVGPAGAHVMAWAESC